MRQEVYLKGKKMHVILERKRKTRVDGLSRDGNSR